ncbi:hypothetical protein MIPYR_40020 [uncultured Microbacterium sp.]|uniref:Uncharacterized protein n=1 Tax=uncultured Microbacterium sp. TaxID=191216 RepID=A0A1Y5P3D1_9MICO|nr:hypothetical protein MIPYR_40020 [uncultured Microbacterium sp.]
MRVITQERQIPPRCGAARLKAANLLPIVECPEHFSRTERCVRFHRRTRPATIYKNPPPATISKEMIGGGRSGPARVTGGARGG